MKRLNRILVGATALAFAFVASGHCGAVAYAKNLTSGVVAATTSYVVDLDTNNIDRSAWQANMSSATPAVITFDDGVRSTTTLTISQTSSLGVVPATMTITVVGTSSLQAVKSTATITVSTSAGLTGQNLFFRSRTFTFGVDIATATTSTGTAANIANYFTVNPVLGVTASSSSANVLLTAIVAGPGGNAFSMSASSSALTISGSSQPFSGGSFGPLLNTVMTVQGINYPIGVQWASSNLSSSTAISTFTATSMASLLNKIAGIKASTMTSNGSVVTATSTLVGSLGNALSITFTSSNGAITQSSTSFTGGSDSATITMNGTSLTYATDFTPIASSSGVFIASVTAKSISNAINNAFAGTINSTYSVAGVITASATFSGVNAYTVSSNKSYLVFSSTQFTGGLLSDINIAADTINAPAHGLATAYSVLFASSAGTVPAPLVGSVTYYAIIVDTNTIKLAATSTGAISGVPINISSQTQIGGGSFTLTPTAIAGALAFKWQVSNDLANWTDMGVASATFVATDTAKSSMWDFGVVNYRAIRALITSVLSGGGANLTIIGNGKAQ